MRTWYSSLAFNDASKNPGIADMANPDYKVELGEDTYFLWINKDSGTTMNINDSHTTYTLSEALVKEVNKVLKSH